IAFKNSTVTKGRGRGIVVGTGLNTEIGKIAKSLGSDPQDGTKSSKKSDKTPLQITLERTMYVLLGVAIVLGVVVFAASGFRWSNETLLYAVSVGVAIIPEGLPAVLIVVLSQGVSRMAKQKAIVRKISSLEALGKVTDIVSDKTGTAVTQAHIAQTSYIISARGLQPSGDIFVKNGGSSSVTVSKSDIQATNTALYRAALVAYLCKTSTLYLDDDQHWKATGDPTEVALDVFSRKALDENDEFVNNLEFMGEQPFDPSIKRMSVAYLDRKAGQVWVLVKGAVERTLECSIEAATKNGFAPISEDFLSSIHNETENLASEALRVLSLAYKVFDVSLLENETAVDLFERLGLDKRLVLEHGLTFLGLVGMYDPPRHETKGAVLECIQAGITVRMATGDHITTARAIAQQVSIIGASEATDPALVVAAAEFDNLAPEEVDARPKLPRVLARCAPASKVGVVRALHKREKFVAMTGDGSNDAPALKAADIGIAMGLGGSEVTKSIASIVLTDDNFATIVAAIQEGRRIFENITKFIVHLFTGNIAEVIILVIGLACRNKYGEAIFPMSPIQILWVNMVTSSPIALALGQERASSDIMRKPPKPIKSGVFTTEVIMDMIVYGVAQGVLSLATFLIPVFATGTSFSDSGHCNHSYAPSENCDTIFKARATAFVTLTLQLLVHGFNCRHARKSAFKSRLHANKSILAIAVLGLILTGVTVYIPFVNTDVFMQGGITWEWGLIIGSTIIFQAIVELYKGLKRRYMQAL
ncbi:calcium ATPase, partial [Gonapodya prolifera JEL478]